MIFNMAGGGGTSLNFTVVGGTSQPSSPKENTIWVNTSTTITSWVFSAEQPSNPSSGMVWIQTGDFSNIAFNALKKNNLQVYPLSAKQYVSYSWVTKTVKAYQSGTWAESWNGQLYDAGEEYNAYTGGWEAKDGELANNRGITKGTESITVSINRPAGNNHQESIAGTVNQIDLTNFDTLLINLTAYSSSEGSSYTRFGVFKSDVDSMDAYINPSGTGTFRLDVSTLQGSYYVCFGCYSSVSGSSPGAVSATMTANLIQAL